MAEYIIGFIYFGLFRGIDLIRIAYWVMLTSWVSVYLCIVVNSIRLYSIQSIVLYSKFYTYLTLNDLFNKYFLHARVLDMATIPSIPRLISK